MNELMAAGAVVVGRRTFELADGWGGDHHDGVPAFVLTHDVPDDPPPGSVRYVTDVHECAAQARAAAGNGDVMVHGAGAAQALLRAGPAPTPIGCGPSTSSPTCSQCHAFGWSQSISGPAPARTRPAARLPRCRTVPGPRPTAACAERPAHRGRRAGGSSRRCARHAR